MSENYAFPDCLMLFRRDREMTQGDHFVHDPSDWHWYVRADLYEAAEAEVERLRTALKLVIEWLESASITCSPAERLPVLKAQHDIIGKLAALTTKGDTP